MTVAADGEAAAADAVPAAWHSTAIHLPGRAAGVRQLPGPARASTNGAAR